MSLSLSRTPTATPTRCREKNNGSFYFNGIVRCHERNNRSFSGTVRCYEMKNRSFSGTVTCYEMKNRSFHGEDRRISFPIQPVFSKLYESKGKHQKPHALRLLGDLLGFKSSLKNSFQVGNFVRVTTKNDSGVVLEGLVVNKFCFCFQLLHKGGAVIIGYNEVNSITLLIRNLAKNVWKQITCASFNGKRTRISFHVQQTEIWNCIMVTKKSGNGVVYEGIIRKHSYLAFDLLDKRRFDTIDFIDMNGFTLLIRNLTDKVWKDIKVASFDGEGRRISFPVQPVFPKLSDSKGKHQILNEFMESLGNKSHLKKSFWLGHIIRVTKENKSGLVVIEGLVVSKSFSCIQILHKGGIEFIVFDDIVYILLLARDGAEKVWDEIKVAIPGVEKDFEGVNLDGNFDMAVHLGMIISSDK